MKDILREIAQAAVLRTEKAKTLCSPEEMKALALAQNTDTGFPFEMAIASGKLAFICECKKASPSKGVIAEDYPYLKIAMEYEEAGADAVSVLTEPEWFMGNASMLKDIAATIKLPVLRKDFVVDSYMIFEAKTLGASAILLICSLLDAPVLREYVELCHRLGLSALVEARDEAEISKALNAGARIIGVNNRNLSNFTVNTDNSVRLRRLVPDPVLFVAESGISTAENVALLRQAGANAVLIGEALMTANNKKTALTSLRGN